jgi:hypothetical protein
VEFEIQQKAEKSNSKLTKKFQFHSCSCFLTYITFKLISLLAIFQYNCLRGFSWYSIQNFIASFSGAKLNNVLIKMWRTLNWRLAKKL